MDLPPNTRPVRLPEVHSQPDGRLLIAKANGAYVELTAIEAAEVVRAVLGEPLAQDNSVRAHLAEHARLCHAMAAGD